MFFQGVDKESIKYNHTWKFIKLCIVTNQLLELPVSFDFRNLGVPRLF